MHGTVEFVRGAVAAGAAGYVLKGVGRRELLAAVRAVGDGECVFDPALVRALAVSSPPSDLRVTEALTPVELEVLRLIADGLTNRQIGEQMRWSVATAKKYVQRILEKLEVTDRTQAAVAALRRGLVG
jgi:DNA-binding NarL/FixJ family response regulator